MSIDTSPTINTPGSFLPETQSQTQNQVQPQPQLQPQPQPQPQPQVSPQVQPRVQPQAQNQTYVPLQPPAQPQVSIQQPNSNLREEMVANAVAFLTHPKVMNSPEDRKRKFLKQKGLTDEEINEAFLRSLGGGRSAMLSAPPAPATSSSLHPSISSQIPPFNAVSDYGRVPQSSALTKMQFSPSQSSPPPLPMMSTSSPYVPYQLITPWKTIILVVLVLVGVGSTIAKWLRKFIFWYFGRRKETTKEKLDKITRQIEEVTQKIKTQEEDLNEAMTTIRTFIENTTDNEVSRKRVEELRKRQENAKLSDLRKEINVIKAMLPALQFDNYTLQSEFLDQYTELKNELISLKQMLLEKHKISKEKRKKEGTNLGSTGSTTSTDKQSNTPNALTGDSNNTNGRTSVTNGTNETAIPWLKNSKKSVTQTMPSWLISSAENTTIPEWQLELDKKQQEDQRRQTANSNNHPNNTENSETHTRIKIPVSTPPSDANLKEKSVSENKNTNLPSTSEANANNDMGKNESTPSHVTHFESKEMQPPYSQNVLQVIEMLQQGRIPPNIRNDINDQPEDPEKPFNVKGTLGQKPKVFNKVR